MKTIALLFTASFVCFGVALLGLVVLASGVSGTTRATACVFSTGLGPPKSAPTTAAAMGSDLNCGAASMVTLPSASVVNHGLPGNYSIPAEATAACAAR